MVVEQGLRCPMCSTLNQVENVFCSNCGARLVPLVAAPPVESKVPPAPPIKGLSLPAKPASPVIEAPKPESKIEPPPQPQPKVEETLAPAVEPVVSEPGVKIPVAQESPDTEQGEIPDWIANLRSLPPAESVEDDGIAIEEIPDWLKPSSLDVTPQAVASAPEPEPTPEPKLEPEPEPAPAPEPEPEPVEPHAPKMKIEVPDWLSQIGTPIKPVEPGAEPIKSDELPDWLKQATADLAPAPSTPSIPHDELPDWLRPETPTQEPEPTVTREPESVEPVFDESIQVPLVSDQAVTLETPSEVGEIPDWLRDAVAVQPQESIAPTLTPETELPVEAPALGEMPAWVAALKPKDADAIAPSFGAEKS